MNRRRRIAFRFRAVFLAPILAFLTLAAWAVASPVGASPDDDFHLVSAWCANGSPEYCQPGDTPETRVVPGGLLHSSCYAFDGEKSASCQIPFMSEPAAGDTLSGRGNFQSTYPPLFYKTMGLMAGSDIELSVVIMRLVNAALFVTLATLLYLLLPIGRRPMLVWAWLLTTVPLGLFLIASTNPSGWAVTGVGMSWIALLGYFETEGRRRIALGALFILAVFMAAGSRGDSALYVIVAIGVVLLLTFTREKAYFLSALLPIGAVAIPVAFILTSRMIGSGLNGLGESEAATDDGGSELSGFGLFAYNILNVPFLWTGVFGGWGLGWLDTTLPKIVLWSCAAAFIGAGFVGLTQVDRRKLVAVSGVTLLLAVIPAYILTVGGDRVGAGVQPRYILPLIVILGGLLLYEPMGRTIRFTRGQVILLVGALAIGNFVSLQSNIRRYITGVDQAGLNLDSGREWWWDTPITPNMVWLIGSAAFAGTLVLLCREVAWRREDGAQEPTSGRKAKTADKTTKGARLP